MTLYIQCIFQFSFNGHVCLRNAHMTYEITTAIVLALSLASIPPSFPLALIDCYDLISKHITKLNYPK